MGGEKGEEPWWEYTIWKYLKKKRKEVTQNKMAGMILNMSKSQ